MEILSRSETERGLYLSACLTGHPEARPILSEFRNRFGFEIQPCLEILNKPDSALLGKRIPKGAARMDVEIHRQVRAWIDSGLGLAHHRRAGLLFVQGDPRVVGGSLVWPANSRKPRHPTPKSRWLRATRLMVEAELKHDPGACLLTSLGAVQFDLVAYLARRLGRPAVVVLDDDIPAFSSTPARGGAAGLYGSFLAGLRHLLVSPFSPGSKIGLDRRRRIRDRTLNALAEKILVVEISGRGAMNDLLQAGGDEDRRVTVCRPARFDQATAGNKNLLEGKAGVSVFNTNDPAGPSVRGKRYVSRRTGRQVPSSGYDLASGWLVHYTRRCPGPWPGQELADYYRSLIDDEDGAAHQAFDTLLRILTEKRIRSSSHFVRGALKVVSFTARPAPEVHRLVRWRRGLARWTMEPYGIGIDRAALWRLGARPVVYGPETTWKKLPGSEQYRFQLHFGQGGSWKPEKEWRIRGDLRLDHLSPDDIRVVVPSAAEAAMIEARFDLKTVLCL